MAENVADGEVKISGDITSLKSFVLEVKRALSSLEKGKVDITLGATDKITPEVKKVTKQVADLDKKKATPKLGTEDKATSTLSKVGRAVKELHGAKATAKVDVEDHATAKLEKIGASIKRYISGATIMAGVYFLGRGLKSLGGDAIDSASDMEQYRITLENLMGSAEAAGAMLDWVVKFAAKTPFEIPGLMEATVRLQAYGIDARDVLETIGDASAALGKDVMEGVEAVADAQTGEFERLKEFGIKAVEVGKDQLAQYALGADAMGKTMLMYTDRNGKEAFKLVDRNNREIVTSNIMAIWNERYSGMMAKQADSWKGLVSNIKDAWTQGLTKVGEVMLPILKPYLEGLLSYLSSDKFTAFINNVANGVAAAIPKIADFARSAWDFIKGVWEAFSGATFTAVKFALETFGGLLKMLGSNMDALKPVILAIGAAFVTWKIIDTATGWINSLSGILGKFTGHAKNTASAATGWTNGIAELGDQAAETGAKAASGFGKFMSSAAPIAGAVVGVGMALWGSIDATNRQWQEFGQAQVKASELGGELDTLRTRTANCKVGTEEYTTALQAQRAKAKEVVEASKGVGAIYDETGQVVDANTNLISALAGQYNNLNPAVAKAQTSVMKGNATFKELNTTFNSQNRELDDAKKKLDDYSLKLAEKRANGEKVSRAEMMELGVLQTAYDNSAKNVAASFDLMKQVAADYAARIQGPDGPSATTERDLSNMTGMMQSKVPEVRNLGFSMFQQLVNAEIAKHPEIQRQAQEIMASVQQMIAEGKTGPEMTGKLNELVTLLQGSDPQLAGMMQLIMANISDSISSSDAPNRFRDIVQAMADVWDSWTPEQKVLYITTSEEVGAASAAPTAHSGGEITRFGVRMHSGGEVPIIGLVGEFVQQRAAVDYYGLSVMNALNERRIPREAFAGTGGHVVHQHHWGPVSFPNVRTAADAEALREAQNRMAEEAEAQIKSAGGYTR